MQWEERLYNYRRVMLSEPYMANTDVPRGDLELDLTIQGRWVFGMWLLGQNWKVPSGYYGGYPGNYLKRIAALFLDKQRVLHLFAGKADLSQLPGDTVDIRAELRPTFRSNAETLEGVPLETYDLIVADPPYSAEDAEHYGTPMVRRDKVMRSLERLKAGCHVVWLDQVLPRYRAQYFTREAVIGVSRSTGHRFRVVNIFRRLEAA
jgi:hypothetical protein